MDNNIQFLNVLGEFLNNTLLKKISKMIGSRWFELFVHIGVPIQEVRAGPGTPDAIFLVSQVFLKAMVCLYKPTICDIKYIYYSYNMRLTAKFY